MWSYKFSVIVVFFSVWFYVGDTFMHLSSSSMIRGRINSNAKPVEEKKVPEEPSFFLKATSELGNMTQSMRRSLKILRKWCRSHPTEVKLGKCLASYFNIKIPGLRRSESPFPDYDDFDETTEKIESRGLGHDEQVFLGRQSNTSLIAPGSWTGNVGLILEKYYGRFAGNLKYYRDLIINNHLVICMWHYLEKKFWLWVDEAPMN